MNCPNCDATDTIITRTMEALGDSVKRIRLCLSCKFHFETTEQYSGKVAGQAFQASMFNTMISEESRAKAKEAIERRNGKCSPSAPFS